MRFVAVTSCPTGIAHTYMAAEALELAAQGAGHEIQVETQGSAGTVRLDPETIAQAEGVIFAADLEIIDRSRFADKPLVTVGVKEAVQNAPDVIAQAIAAVETQALPALADDGADRNVLSAPGNLNVPVLSRIKQWLMTGISYMIPFVAAGGILISLSFIIAQAAWGENGAVEVTTVDPQTLVDSFSMLSGQNWAALFFLVGSAAFSFLVPVLAGFIAYAIADRPGLVPGFVGGAIAVTVGAGFLGGLAAGFLGGFLALWISRIPIPTGAKGLMPVVVVPFLSTLVTGFLMFVVLGHPLSSLMTGLSSWLSSLSGSNLVVLGVLLGAMMGFDLGGPVNKVAYTFAVTGIAGEELTASSTEFKIMAAVVAAGMVAPLAMALATVVRKNLFTEAERDSGKAAWLLGASFISEGAIPFAAVDPLRVLTSSTIGSAVTGGLVMAFGVTLRAPHGGIWMLPLMGNPLMFAVAVIAGTIVSATTVILLKSLGSNAPAVLAQ